MLFITFPLTIDLFASRLTHKLDHYVSWKADHSAMKFNAFSFKWPDYIYMFPAVPLINKTIIKFLCFPYDRPVPNTTPLQLIGLNYFNVSARKNSISESAASAMLSSISPNTLATYQRYWEKFVE